MSHLKAETTQCYREIVSELDKKINIGGNEEFIRRDDSSPLNFVFTSFYQPLFICQTLYWALRVLKK